MSTTIRFHGRDKRVELLLCEIAEEREKDAGCLVTAVVVYKGEGDQQPGGGFFELAEKLDYDYEDKNAFYADQLGKAIAYWRSQARSDPRRLER